MSDDYYHVPATVAEMLPPKPASLRIEAANFLRAHHAEVLPDLRVLSGEAPSIHGSYALDEAACVFKIQAIAKANGFAFLGSVQAAKLLKALRSGYKYNTGTAMRVLKSQYKKLQITHQE